MKVRPRSNPGPDFLRVDGALAPRTGAHLLNVEDAEKLRHERPILSLSAVACLLTGLFFLTLAAIPADGDGRLLSREIAAMVAGGCLIVLVAMTRWTNRNVDELTRQVSVVSSAFAMHAIMLLLGGWASLAHLGYAVWISPLAFVSGLALLQLVAISWVSEKRGLLRPR